MRLYLMDLRVRVLAAIDAGDPTAEVAYTFVVSPAGAGGWSNAAGRRRPDLRAARNAWQAEVAPALDTHRVVYVDGTADNTTMDRRYGYGPRGQPVNRSLGDG